MASIVLVAFASRMLIPPGFMPASGRPFLLEICREGLSADMLAHAMPAHSTARHGPLQEEHHHPGSPAQSEHCVFGTASGAGPIPHLPLPSDFSSAPQLRAFAFASIGVAVRVVHLPQPRAPPLA